MHILLTMYLKVCLVTFQTLENYKQDLPVVKYSNTVILTLPLMLEKNRTITEKGWQLPPFCNNFWVEKSMDVVITTSLSVSNHIKEQIPWY